MHLYALFDLVKYQMLNADRDTTEVRLLIPGGERYEILSLNWDDENDEWVLIGEDISE